MNPIELADEIAKYLKDVNKTYDSKEKQVEVITGFIPDMISSKDKKNLCPRIIVRPQEITDNYRDLSGGQTEVKMLITYLTYNEVAEDAYRLIYNWLEKNRMALLKKRHFGDCQMTMPLTTKILDEELQPRPMWGAYILATYIGESIGEEGLITDDYGYE